MNSVFHQFHLLKITYCFLMIRLASSDSSKETSKDSMQKASTKIPLEAYSTTYVDSLNKNSFWVYRPISRANDLSILPQERSYRNSKPVQSLTKLTKSLTLGADPYFNKDYFEPFERRAKPITLVTFRKKGMLPRKNVQDDTEKKSPEVAELQSPYNEVGTFWQEESE